MKRSSEDMLEIVLKIVLPVFVRRRTTKCRNPSVLAASTS